MQQHDIRDFNQLLFLRRRQIQEQDKDIDLETTVRFWRKKYKATKKIQKKIDISIKNSTRSDDFYVAENALDQSSSVWSSWRDSICDRLSLLLHHHLFIANADWSSILDLDREKWKIKLHFEKWSLLVFEFCYINITAQYLSWSREKHAQLMWHYSTCFFLVVSCLYFRRREHLECDYHEWRNIDEKCDWTFEFK